MKNNIEESLINLSENLTCPYCQTEISVVTFFQNDKSRPHKGDFFCCMECGNISMVGDSDLVKISREGLKKLDPMTRQILKKKVTESLLTIASKPENRKS